MEMLTPALMAPKTRVAEHQPEFTPVEVAYVRNPLYGAPGTEHGPLNTSVMAFKPSDEERALIAAGGNIYVSLLTFMKPQQGIIVSVGPESVASWAVLGAPGEEKPVEVAN